MRKKTLVEAFELNWKETSPAAGMTDYEVFRDKDLLEDLRRKIVQNLIDQQLPDGPLLKDYIDREIDRTLEGYDLSNLERTHVFQMIDQEIHGFGPISELLRDEAVTEIFVHAPSEIYIETEGKRIRDDSVSFINSEHILRTIERMLQPLGKTLDSLHPFVEGRLPDGSKLTAMVPPLSLNGPVLTIQKQKKNILSMDEFLRLGTVTPYMARFLEAAVQSRLNILIIGGTTSGKTTLLNALGSFISSDERIVTIEEVAQLHLPNHNVIAVETCNVSTTLQDVFSMGSLIQKTQSMRPDRYLLGELRGMDSAEFLQILNSGYRGSMATFSAGSIDEAFLKLEKSLLSSHPETSLPFAQEAVVRGLDLIVQVERLADGRRKVISISEPIGIKDERIRWKEIFAFRTKGISDRVVDGEFVLYNYFPEAYQKIKLQGLDTIDDIFAPIAEKRKKEVR